jgi:hypothetical protein
VQRLADLKAEWAQRRSELQAIKQGPIALINQRARAIDVPHISPPGD